MLALRRPPDRFCRHAAEYRRARGWIVGSQVRRRAVRDINPVSRRAGAYVVRGPRPATMSSMPGFRARAGRMRSAEEEIQKPQQAGTDRGPLLWTLRLPIRQPGQHKG